MVDQSATSTWNQTLSKQADLTLFEEEQVFFGVQIDFQGTQGQLAKVRPSDYIHIRAVGAAEVKADFSDDEGGGS